MQDLDSKPNLFIVGAMKSGTTSLNEYLDLHPDIFMSDEKEPGYPPRQTSWHRIPHINS
jgi:hypothetical protein